MNARLAVAPAVGLRARGRPLAPLPAAADALGGAPSAPSSTASSPATKLYPNLDLDFVPAMTPAEWARGLALAVFTGALHAAFVAKLFRCTDAALVEAQLRCLFVDVDVRKPASSRDRSVEAFVVARDFRGGCADAAFLKKGDLGFAATAAEPPGLAVAAAWT